MHSINFLTRLLDKHQSCRWFETLYQSCDIIVLQNYNNRNPTICMPANGRQKHDNWRYRHNGLGSIAFYLITFTLWTDTYRDTSIGCGWKQNNPAFIYDTNHAVSTRHDVCWACGAVAYNNHSEHYYCKCICHTKGHFGHNLYNDYNRRARKREKFLGSSWVIEDVLL